ncbi:prophage antirepressor [Clostridium sp. ASBs410]|nr:prophage antirepressor [Clostridium sp. ASBs410]
MNELMIFDNEEFGLVRSIVINNEPWFVGKDVAAALGYVKPTDAVRKHVGEDDRGISKLETPSGVQDMVIVNESGLYALIFGSKLETAKKFKRWVTAVVLPSIRKNGTYETPESKKRISFKEQVECIGVVADMLRVNDASKLMMIGQLYKSYDLPAEFLPMYEFNGSRELKSATDLLKRFDLGMSARNFNVLMREQGYLEERTRKSSSSPNGTKKYNALTEKGLRYGENAVSPQCQREVQPMYYADSFKELFEMLVGLEVA